VERGDRRIEMVHKNMADRSAAYWTLASGPDEKNSSASSWLRKLFRLRIDSFAADRSRDTLETAFTATVHPRSGKTTKIEFFKGPAEETSSNEKSAKASQPTWFGRSGFTRELVELATDRVSTLASDIETLKSKGQGSESSDGSE
ncbi:MAG: hypothetical protein ABEL76_00705, partial [Bradymonadaceae bacterium]